MTQNSCNCELCLFKAGHKLDKDTHILDKDTHKLIEAIIHHFIFRLSSSVKHHKKMNTYIVLFIIMVNPDYVIDNDDSKLKESISIIYKHIMAGGLIHQYSGNASINKLMNKEADYLKMIITAQEKQKIEKIEKIEKLEQKMEKLEQQKLEQQELEQKLEQKIEQSEDITTVVVIDDIERTIEQLVDIENSMVDVTSVDVTSVDVTSVDVTSVDVTSVDVTREDVIKEVETGSYLAYCVIS
jgi:hypothetical protein